MKVALINCSPRETGIGKYAFELFNQLKNKISIDMIYTGYNNLKKC